MKNILTLILTVLSVNCIQAQTFDQAKAEFQNENFSSAKKILLQLIKTDNSSLTALYLGNTYLMTEETDSAKFYYKKAETGTDAYSFIAKGKVALIESNDITSALVHIEKAVTMSRKKDSEVYFQAGYSTFMPKPVHTAQLVKYLEEAVAMAPANVYYALILGDVYQTMPNGGGKAMSIYEDMAAKYPNNALPFMRIGRLFYSSTNYPVAIENLEKANALNPNFGIVHKELGELYYIERKYEKAKEEFKKYIDINANDPKAKSIYLGFLYQFKDYQKAIDEINVYLKTDSTNYVYHRLLAYCYQELKQSKIAQLEIDKFWQYVGKNKVTKLDYTYAGKIAVSNGDTLNAINCLRTATEMDSTNADLQTDFALTLFNFKKYKESIAQYKKRIAMPQKAASALDIYYLGRAYFADKDFLNSDSTFATFVIMQPKSPDGYLWRAKSNVELDDKKNFKGLASPHYLKFIELGAADVARNKANLITAYNYLAIVSLTQKDEVKAKEYFNKVLELDPNNKIAQDEVKKLK